MISVVIPLYNKAQSIRSTLDSVLAQTYSDWECVIVDDGSTDGSAAVCEEFVHSLNPSRVHSFRIIHQPNAGVSAARNTGILAAKGEYIAFLDADDLWAPTYFAELASLIADFPDAGLYSLGHACISGSTIPTEYGNDEKCLFRGRVEHPWTSPYSIWTGSSSSSKKRLMEVGLFDTRMAYGEDLDMWYRLVLAGGMVVCNKVLAFYRQDTENRAMHRVIPLEKHIPCYMNKFAEARKADMEFRRYFDREMIYRLYQYLFIPEYAEIAQRLAKQIDYSLQKKSMKWRMQWPYLYRLYLSIVGREYRQF